MAWYSFDSLVNASPHTAAEGGKSGGSAPPGGEGYDLRAVAQVVFIGLSAVTVPHMIITEVAQVRQRALQSCRKGGLAGVDDIAGDAGAVGMLRER